MKKLHFLIATAFVVVLTSCSPKVLYQTNVGYIDYSEYAKEGMFLTESNSVSFDYTPLGSVSATVFSGNVERTRPDRFNYVDANGVRQDEKYSQWKEATPEDAIEVAVVKAKEQGGDGIINIKIEPFSTVTDKATRTGLIVSGMVIKRK